jgi:molecular chaperone GrpE
MKPEDKKEEGNSGGKAESAAAGENDSNAQTEPAVETQQNAEPATVDNSGAQAEPDQADGEGPEPGRTGKEPGGAGGEPESETERLTRELEEAKNLVAENYERAAENYDKFVRLQAEVENYKKRVQKERVEEGRYAHLPVMRDLMGILANLQRALEHARNDAGDGTEGILAGVEMVAKQLNDIFERHGMKRIVSVGEPFDPTMHEAMAMVENDEVPENQVVEEFEAGYFLHERVVEPAKVTVSKKPAQPGPAADTPQE